MQVFIYKDRGFTRELTERAARAGYDALVLTIDNQFTGNRERDLRNGFTIPPSFRPADIALMALKAPWLWRMRNEVRTHHLRQLCPPGPADGPQVDRRPDGVDARSGDVVEGCRRAAAHLEAAR